MSLPDPTPSARTQGIDPRSPRFGAGITAVLLLVDLFLALVGAIVAAAVLLLAIALLFAWGAFAGIRRHPYGALYRALIRPRLAPPTEVADAFDEVQRAEQDQERFQEEARQYSNTLLGDARGQAAQMREDAAAYKNRVVQEAEGQASRFTSVYDEYAKAPEVTRERLFLETMEQVLGSSQKVIVDKGAGSGVVPYLPLPELRPNTGITPPANSSSTTPSAQGK